MIRNWVAAAVDDLGVPCRPLDGDAVAHLVGEITAKYTDGPVGYFLWEAFRNDRSVCRADGWRLAASYCRTGPCLLVRDGDRWAGYRFDDAEGLAAVLGETPGFEFFVTDERTGFVLCFNHHDYLVGAGDCLGWLGSIAGE